MQERLLGTSTTGYQYLTQRPLRRGVTEEAGEGLREPQVSMVSIVSMLETLLSQSLWILWILWIPLLKNGGGFRARALWMGGGEFVHSVLTPSIVSIVSIVPAAVGQLAWIPCFEVSKVSMFWYLNTFIGVQVGDHVWWWASPFGLIVGPIEGWILQLDLLPQ